MAYVWRKVGVDRWLCIAVGKPRVVVGDVIRVGICRYRIQLRTPSGGVISPPVIFDRLKIAQRVLILKLSSPTATTSHREKAAG